MSLLNAGVPIHAPVAGIAMGLVQEGEHFTILTDIQGMEDALGDMDFKVAGTSKGVTAIQMDIKIHGLSRDILLAALQQARKGRLFILGKIAACIDKPADHLSLYAPKITVMTIPVDKSVMLLEAAERQSIKLSVRPVSKWMMEEERTYFIFPRSDENAAAAARKMVENLTHEVKTGRKIPGTCHTADEIRRFCGNSSGQRRAGSYFTVGSAACR